MPSRDVTRRDLLKIGAATAAAELAAVLLPGCGGGGTSPGPAPSVCSKLTDIEHVVIFIQENRSEEHTSELQSRLHLVCRLLLEKKKTAINYSLHMSE